MNGNEAALIYLYAVCNLLLYIYFPRVFATREHLGSPFGAAVEILLCYTVGALPRSSYEFG